MKAGVSSCEDLAAFCEREISKAVLGQTLTSEQGEEGGSNALGQVHENVMSMYGKPDAIKLMNMLNH